MSMHKANVYPVRKPFVAAACAVVCGSVLASIAGFGFFGVSIILHDHVDWSQVEIFVALAALLMACLVPYLYLTTTWGWCEECGSAVMFRKKISDCQNCKAHYVEFGGNVYRGDRL